MAQTVWSILPPVITIVLALWTKEVYMSLIIGIFSGALLFTGGNILESIPTMFAVMEDKVGGNVNILVFLVILGILVAAITRSGATRAYGAWAAKAIHGKRSASLLTALLGAPSRTSSRSRARSSRTSSMRRPRRSASSRRCRAGRRPSARRCRKIPRSTASRCSCRQSRSTFTPGARSSS